MITKGFFYKIISYLCSLILEKCNISVQILYIFFFYMTCLLHMQLLYRCVLADKKYYHEHLYLDISVTYLLFDINNVNYRDNLKYWNSIIISFILKNWWCNVSGGDKNDFFFSFFFITKNVQTILIKFFGYLIIITWNMNLYIISNIYGVQYLK